MSAHTQGPWVVGYPADGSGITGPTASPLVWWDGLKVGREIITVDSRVIAIVARDGGLEDEDRANARLIAAAPELLAAAQKVLAHLNAHIDAASAAGLPVPLFEVVADLHAAIAAATGQKGE